jgi:putative acetyltransferase
VSDVAGLTIRPERSSDEDAVDELLRRSFGDDVPARLARRLRADGLFVPSLTTVACTDRQLVGSLMMSRLIVRGDEHDFEVLNLTPFAVAPAQQGLGIGRRLMAWSLQAAERTAYPLVVLEGDPRHYRRYGFVRSSDHGIQRPSEKIPASAFQVRPLVAHRPGVHRGAAIYAPAFHELGVIGP